MPKQKLASISDARFAKGDMKVITYLEGRTNYSSVEDEIANYKDESKEILQEKKEEIESAIVD